MKPEEIQELVKRPEVMEWIRKHLDIETSVEACDACLGYDIYVTVYLDGEKIGEDEDGI